MAFDREQFEALIEDTLKEHKLYSPAAVQLLLGTAAQESDFGTYLRQIRGPALGVFQMEPATFRWMVEKYGAKYGFTHRSAWDLVWDLKFAILLARLRYLAVPGRLPEAGDIQGLAAYWKKYYNTDLGRGTREMFIKNYVRHVGWKP